LAILAAKKSLQQEQNNNRKIKEKKREGLKFVGNKEESMFDVLFKVSWYHKIDHVLHFVIFR